MEQKILEIAQRTNAVLKHYMAIQNELFKPSLRKMIRLPGIYKPIDYSGNCQKLEEIISELECIKTSIRDISPDNKTEDGNFLILQRAYITGMLKAVVCVKEIAEKLYQRSTGHKDYTQKDYKEDIEVFKKAELEFLEIGLKLNEMIYKK